MRTREQVLRGIADYLDNDGTDTNGYALGCIVEILLDIREQLHTAEDERQRERQRQHQLERLQ